MKKSTVFEIGGKEFDVVKTGRAQAEQVADLARWVSKYGMSALGDITDKETGIVTIGGMDMFAKLLTALPADALIDMFILIFGCSKAFANRNFDIALLIDAMITVYEENPSFQRLISRFFSSTLSEDDMEGQSMISEEPTVTQTK